ncbi:hypothetical protein Glove_109g127 [Diversispora epigaea]|uniref:Uncharacterized protein n=1 Tax=Diversispora epigaea TaxID=1348612 RepID=A0A397J234_9GLOM|nr:hypothetical protein Glove_109g127 [Diversispora epigaea]
MYTTATTTPTTAATTTIATTATTTATTIATTTATIAEKFFLYVPMIFFHYNKFFNYRFFFASSSFSLSSSFLSSLASSSSHSSLFTASSFSSFSSSFSSFSSFSSLSSLSSSSPPFISTSTASTAFTSTSKFKLYKRIDFSSNLIQPLRQPLQQQSFQRYWINRYFIRNDNKKSLQTRHIILPPPTNNNYYYFTCRRHNTTTTNTTNTTNSSSSNNNSGDNQNNSSNKNNNDNSNSSKNDNSNESNSTNSQNAKKNNKPILKELVYGRTRIYTALPPASSHSPTSSKSSPTTSSSPIHWQWQPQASSSSSKIPEEKGPVTSFKGSIKQSLSAMFLPVGYPDSVHECYAKFHFWLGLETFIGSSTGVLCSQAMLSSLGLGHAEAAAGAVAIQWVLKDGFGEIGKLFFIKRFAYSFDSHPKTWKMISELFAITGYFLQLCTCIVRPSFFLPLASLGNAFESIQYSILGACHMAFVRNFALSGNVGDVVAKDDAQMSFAHLLGMLCGIGMITVSHEPAFLFTCFTAFAPFNVYITLALLNSAQFEILNQAKLALIARQYIDCDKVPTMEELKDREIGFGEWIRPGKSPIGVKIKLGVTASEAFRRTEDMMDSLDVLWNENYLQSYHPHSNTINILYHSDAESNDVIKSILHSIKFHDIFIKNISINGVDMKDIKGNNISNEDITLYIRKALRESHKWTNEKFGKFVAELDDKDWQSDVVFWSDKGFRVKWERNKEEKI